MAQGATGRTQTTTEPHRVRVDDLPTVLVVAGLYAAASAVDGQWDDRNPALLTVAQVSQLAKRATHGIDASRGHALGIAIVSGVLDAHGYDTQNAAGAELASAIVEQLRWARDNDLLEDFPNPAGMVAVAELALDVLERIDRPQAYRIAAADGRAISLENKMMLWTDITGLDLDDRMTPAQAGEILRDAECEFVFLRDAWAAADRQVGAGIDPEVAYTRTARRLGTTAGEWALLQRAHDALAHRLHEVSGPERPVAWAAFADDLIGIASGPIRFAVGDAIRSNARTSERGGLRD